MEPTNLVCECVQSGSGWTPWAIILSAAAATFIALISVAKQRFIARKKAAHDFLLGLWESDHIEAEKTFREMVSSETLLNVLTAKTTVEIEQRIKVQRYLNRFEILGTSIKNNILDENICKSVIIDHVVFAYEKSLPLVKKLAEEHDGDEEFFCHLREIAEKWKNNPNIEKPGFWLWMAIKEIPRI